MLGLQSTFLTFALMPRIEQLFESLKSSLYKSFNPRSISGCSKTCLGFAGHGQQHMLYEGKHIVLIARITRTIIFYEYRQQFLKQLHKEIKLFYNRVMNKNKKHNTNYICAIRLNVLTDINWEKIDITLFTDNFIESNTEESKKRSKKTTRTNPTKKTKK